MDKSNVARRMYRWQDLPPLPEVVREGDQVVFIGDAAGGNTLSSSHMVGSVVDVETPVGSHEIRGQAQGRAGDRYNQGSELACFRALPADYAGLLPVEREPDPIWITAGIRTRGGHEFRARQLDGEFRISAGCRHDWTVAQARAHWGDPTHHAHAESVRLCRDLIRQAQERGWPVEAWDVPVEQPQPEAPFREGQRVRVVGHREGLIPTGMRRLPLGAEGTATGHDTVISDLSRCEWSVRGAHIFEPIPDPTPDTPPPQAPAQPTAAERVLEMVLRTAQASTDSADFCRTLLRSEGFTVERMPPQPAWRIVEPGS